MSAVTDLKHRAERGARGSGRRRRDGEPIDMKELRFGYFPQAFMRRGRVYAVRAVERCWTVSRRRGNVQRHCFRVRCREGTFDLYRDMRYGNWFLQRRVAGPRGPRG
jgi:hypothetical protein